MAWQDERWHVQHQQRRPQHEAAPRSVVSSLPTREASRYRWQSPPSSSHSLRGSRRTSDTETHEDRCAPTHTHDRDIKIEYCERTSLRDDVLREDRVRQVIRNGTCPPFNMFQCQAIDSYQGIEVLCHGLNQVREMGRARAAGGRGACARRKSTKATCPRGRGAARNLSVASD